MTINIANIYPDILNMYGDKGSIAEFIALIFGYFAGNGKGEAILREIFLHGDKVAGC